MGEQWCTRNLVSVHGRWDERPHAAAAQLPAAFLKLGRETTAGIEHDAARRALLSALAPFAAERGCQVIASGLETAAERQALRRAGVHLGQGLFPGLPAPAGPATSAAIA